MRIEPPHAENRHMIDWQSQLAQDQLTCIECHRAWTEPAERWRIYLTDDETPIQVVYCAACATYEFGP